MTLAHAARVFDQWMPNPGNPEEEGKIWCCAQQLTERFGAIACMRCHTIIERCQGGWRVVRIKGVVVPGKTERDQSTLAT